MKLLPLILLLSLQSCLFSSKVTISGKGNIKLHEVEFSELEDWSEANHKRALQSFNHSCNKFAKMAQNRLVGGQIGNIIVDDFRDVCDIADVVKTMNAKQAQNFFENWFRPFLVTNRYNKSQGLFTGYYEASLKGSVKESEKYQYPVYKVPKDLEFEPYYSRQEIEDGALENKDLEILYVDSAVDLFFLHVQGSGRVELEDGSSVRLAYAGRNNQPYTSIGGYMVDHGLISGDDVNAKSIRKWLNSHPEKAQDVMNQNAAYTFFEVSDNEYVVGAQNVPLTANHSLAVDDEIIPYGLPIWLDSYIKDENNKKYDFNQLLIAQDTGSAITGVVRGDVFFGFGEEAEKKASYMSSKGEYYILLPVNVVDKLSR